MSRRPLARLAAVVLAAVSLSACYVPARFDAEVEVSRSGYYKMDFAGYLAWVPLYEKIRKGEIGYAEEQEKARILEQDLRRDPGVKEAAYYQKGHLRVRYRSEGDLLATGMVTFIRRNEDLISVTYSKPRRVITVRGKYIRRADADRLVDAGLWVEGELRLRTDARILEHNATEVQEGEAGQTLLVWTVDGPYGAAPQATLSLR